MNTNPRAGPMAVNLWNPERKYSTSLGQTGNAAGGFTTTR